MKTAKHYSSLLNLLLLNLFLSAQIHWEVVKEEVNLNPSAYVCKGTLGVRIGSKKDNVFTPVSGEITIDFGEKVIYLNDGKDIFRFKNEIIDNLKIDGYRVFNADELFKRDFNDSIMIFYRQNLYPTLNLNQIQFSSSKRVEYLAEDNALVLKNQKISKGKICLVSPTNIVILHENGELDDFKDGDFNFLQVGSFKAFKCRALYDFIYEDFRGQLSQSIRKWESEIKKSTIDSVISIYGPMDNITSISSDRKVMTWRKERPVYYINMSTFSRGMSSTFQNSQTNIFSNKISSLYGISPFFLFGNSYRTTNISYSGSGLTVIASQSNQSGSVKKEEEGLVLTLITDSNNKILYIYHDHIFTDLGYGSPFRFVSF